MFVIVKNFTTMNTLRQFFLIICLMTFSQVPAQSVRYSYKSLAAEGCRVEYSAIWQNEVPYIVVVVSSDRLAFNDTPTLMMRLFSDELIKLEGKAITSSSQHGGMVVGNIVVPITELRATAQFPMTEEQVEMLQSGVAKVRISTIPLIHERIFRNDKIGKKLYLYFKKGAKSETSF